MGMDVEAGLGTAAWFELASCNLQDGKLVISGSWHEVRGLRFSGFIAWAAWLLVHIFYLIGFENRAVVMFRWAYSYFTRGRGSRLITAAAGR